MTFIARDSSAQAVQNVFLRNSFNPIGAGARGLGMGGAPAPAGALLTARKTAPGEDRVAASLIHRAGGPDDPLKRRCFLFVGPREGEGGGS